MSNTSYAERKPAVDIGDSGKYYTQVVSHPRAWPDYGRNLRRDIMVLVRLFFPDLLTYIIVLKLKYVFKICNRVFFLFHRHTNTSTNVYKF